MISPRQILPVTALVLVFIASSVLPGQKKSVVVTTSMLECAAREVLPASESIEIIRLLPPAACPGHFDLSPRIIPKLHSAVLVLRHDYQDILDKKLSDMGARNISMIEISSTGSPLIPVYYHKLVEEVGLKFAETFPGNHSDIQNTGKAVKKKINELTLRINKTAAPWKGKPVIAAVHQKEFCEWLGFEVTGELKRPEDTSPRDLEKLLSVKAEIIVANFQEGVQSANSLGERKNIPVAVLSNFPGVENFGENYYRLIETNITRLEEAWQKR